MSIVSGGCLGMFSASSARLLETLGMEGNSRVVCDCIGVQVGTVPGYR